MPRVVLMAIDDSDESEAAFLWALEHELQADDALHLLHHMPLAGGDDCVPTADYFDSRTPDRTLHVEEAMLKRRFLGRPELARKMLRQPPVVHLVEGGLDTSSVGRSICQHAEELGAAVVVLVGHDVGCVRRLLVGSVTDWVTKHCSRPVRVVRHADLKQVLATMRTAA